jgi:hypothetical protein
MRILELLKSSFLTATACDLLKYDILRIGFSEMGITMLRFQLRMAGQTQRAAQMWLFSFAVSRSCVKFHPYWF